MLIVLLSALGNAGNILLDKFLLSKKKLKLSQYIPVLFVFLFIITFISLPWLGGINTVLLANRTYLFYFVLMIMLAIMWNMFYYEGLQKERLAEFEMILLLTPLATILMSGFFFPEDFNAPVFIAAVIGGVALFATHIEKRHFEFDKYAIHLLLAVVLIAMETMVQKELLAVYAPATLYALRTGTLAFFFYIYYRPKVARMENGSFKLIFVTAFLGVIAMIARLYGFMTIGITFTTLILLVTPIIDTWVAAKLNNEPVKRKTILGFIIILACVIYATVTQVQTY